MINYLGHAMVGTTDEKADISFTIEPPQKDIDFIINELKAVFGEEFDYQGNLLSSWAGARPLVLASKEEEEIEVQKSTDHDSSKSTPKKTNTFF